MKVGPFLREILATQLLVGQHVYLLSGHVVFHQHVPAQVVHIS